jgi:two-component system, OmpR family, sensor histidine kinase BaeS
MNVRFKLFGAMAIIVLLVSLAYTGTTQGYLESRFVAYARENAMNQEISAEFFRLKAYILHSMLIEAYRMAGFSTIVALLVGLWLTWKLTLPLKRLIPAIAKIAARDFSFQLPVTTKDEYGKVTEALNQMTQQLRKSEELRKNLVANVAHELRTPLSVLQCQLENIQQDGRVVPPENLLPMQDEVIRLSMLVDDLHQLTLAEAGKLPLDKKPTDLRRLLGQLIDNIKLEALEKQVYITQLNLGSNRNVMIDAHRMTQVFYNLLMNAIRYTLPGGNITVQVVDTHQREDVDYTVISITDTGIGIEKELIPNVFERFYRVEVSRSRDTGGMGLGLAIAKQFVEAHQGFIEVESEVGRGSTFSVYLPGSVEGKNAEAS